MQRCLQLACLGAGRVAPNPMVGAVLVHGQRVIAEGYHAWFGGAHAEVNCLNNVPENEKYLIRESRLYVSLEPCSHFGKTPPCTGLIIKYKIPEVIIACNDPFEKVNGSGIEILKAAGIKVTTGILETEATALNKRFFTFHKNNRPYIILKWAQSSNMKIAGANYRPLKITNDITDRLIHKWRSEEAAIMVGTNTALQDNPSLTSRLWPGKNPVRIVIDRDLRLPSSLNLFAGKAETIILNRVKEEISGKNIFYRWAGNKTLQQETVNILMEKNLISLLVEGGTVLLQSFIEEGLWDEARVITNRNMRIDNGITAPELKYAVAVKRECIGEDEIIYFKNTGTPV